MDNRKRREDLSFHWMASNISHKALNKLLVDMEKNDPLHKAASKRKADDPQFIDSEWRRLMQFQKGAK